LCHISFVPTLQCQALETTASTGIFSPSSPPSATASPPLLTTYPRAQNTIERDDEIIEDLSLTARTRVAARLTRIEKSILLQALAAVEGVGGAQQGGALPALPHLRLT